MRTRTRWGLRDVGVAILTGIGLAGLAIYLGLIFAWVVVPLLHWMAAA